MVEFLAKNYKNRKELENAISSEVGRYPENNKSAGNIIKGTRKKLKTLFLDDTSAVWGCKVIITDTSTKKLIDERNASEKK